MKVEERNSLIIKILEQAYYDAISGVVLKDSEFDAYIFYLFNKVINDKVECIPTAKMDRKSEDNG